MLTDPADCGPVVLAMPQDAQVEEFDFPLVDVRAPRAPGPAAAPRPGRPRARRRDPAHRAAPPPRPRWRRALLGSCPRGARLRRGARHPGRGDRRRPDPGAARPPALRRPARHHRGDLGQRPRRPGRRRARGRDPAPGLHHLLVDRVRLRRADRHGQRGPLRRRQALGAGRGGRRASDRRRAGRGAGGLGGGRGLGRGGVPQAGRLGRARRPAARGCRARRQRSPTPRSSAS